MRNAGMPESLAALQQAFAAHIRNPAGAPMPAGIEERRMQIYRRLFFNNVRQFLSGSFPVLHKLYEDKAWTALVRDFYIEYRAQSPLFPDLPREFLRYIEVERQERPGDPPFLLELAHYEWVEAALSRDLVDLDAFSAENALDVGGDLLSGAPVLSPLAWSFSYRYPVHRISPDFRPAEPPELPTHLLVYRNRADTVKFMQLNALSQLMLALLRDHSGLTGHQLLQLTAEQIGHPSPGSVIGHGLQLLENLRSRDVILGTRQAPALAGPKAANL